MKKTLLAAMIAASFGVSAFAANLPATNDAGNPVSFVLSGNVDLIADGMYSNVSTSNESTAKSSLGYEIDTLKIALDVSSPFMGAYTAAGHIDLAQDGDTFGLGNFFVSVANDDFGTLSIGKQASASDDMAYNGFDSYDIVTPFAGSALNSPALSVKYTSPEFAGVTVAASLGATYAGNSTKKDGTTTSQAAFDVQFLSLAAQYANDNLTVAATVDLSKKLVNDEYNKAAMKDYMDAKKDYDDIVKSLKDNPYANKIAGLLAPVGDEPAAPYGTLAVSLGAGYTMDNVTVFGNVGYSTQDAASLGDDAKVEGARPALIGGQLGASVDVTDADNVKAAVQGGYLYVNGKDTMSAYLVGVKAAASHSFNDNFSVGAFVTYNHLGFHKKDVKDQPSSDAVKYGVAVSYDF